MPEPKNNYAIPIAIVIAGVLVAGAVFWGKSPTPQSTAQLQPPPVQTASTEELTKNAPSISASDHVLGNPAAPVTVVEYSDIECPFCRRFHPTMQKVIAEYGVKGQVSWVYRQFPLDIHPKAYPEALASECVVAQSDNATFWKFINALMELKIGGDGQPTGVISDSLSAEERIAEAAKKLNLDVSKISSCVTSQTYRQKISDARTEGIKAGLGQNQTGTPYTVIISGSKRYFVDGAQPYEVVKGLIDKALASS